MTPGSGGERVTRAPIVVVCLSLTLQSALAAAPTAQTAPPSQRYSVTGAAAWEAAAGQGFRSLPRACAASTDARSQSLVIERAGAAACRFALFDGRALRLGWSIEAISDQCSHPGLCRVMLRKSNVPPLSGVIEAGVDRTDSGPFLQIRTLTLSGPPASDWRTAFRR